MEEEGRFEAEVAEVQTWWNSERFELTRRPYTARDVVALRGHLKQGYASNEMAKKLWRTLKSHQANGTASRTFGALDPVQVTMMAKHLDTIYVSGWQCSSTHTSTNEPGPDLADYPYDTVPNKVEHLFFAQQYHDRKQREARMSMSREERTKTPFVDYLKPIIADGDTGFGGTTATVKLCKLFVERGAAGKWSGANYYDRYLKTVQGGISSTAAMGKGVTEEQFKESWTRPGAAGMGEGTSLVVAKSRM
ncbi:hypothetical protein BRARA_C03851 [Brassica rapa]|uniref:Isocitrate lyase n=1 Tax=Brassica campestris TaxID=3711 RepID=A0A398A4I0_BRACM|nr:hypothetical protein BRARA_C03851 [Brassica rapa]